MENGRETRQNLFSESWTAAFLTRQSSAWTHWTRSTFTKLWRHDFFDQCKTFYLLSGFILGLWSQCVNHFFPWPILRQKCGVRHRIQRYDLRRKFLSISIFARFFIFLSFQIESLHIEIKLDKIFVLLIIFILFWFNI